MAIEHASITDPDIHEPKGISTASDGDVYIADGVGGGSWQPAGPAFYQNNVSNAANTTSVPATTDTDLPMNGDGTNNFVGATIATGKCQFDSTFKSNLGGFIVDQLAADTGYALRVTLVNTGANTTATVKAFLVFDKSDPATGVTINAGPFDFDSGVERPVEIRFFDNDIEAIYIQVNSAGARDYQVNGVLIHAWENRVT